MKIYKFGLSYFWVSIVLSLNFNSHRDFILKISKINILSNSTWNLLGSILNDYETCKLQQEFQLVIKRGNNYLFDLLKIKILKYLIELCYTIRIRSSLYYLIKNGVIQYKWPMIDKYILKFTNGKCILAYHWSFVLYAVIFIRHYKLILTIFLYVFIGLSLIQSLRSVSLFSTYTHTCIQAHLHKIKARLQQRYKC